MVEKKDKLLCLQIMRTLTVDKGRKRVAEVIEFVTKRKERTMITEEITDKDLVMLRQIIRFELASVFYDLYRRKNAWAK